MTESAIPGQDTALQHAGMIEVARAHREAGRLAEAEALLSSVLNHNPRSGRALHQLGLTLAAAGRLPEAVKILGLASVLTPTDPDRHADLAAACNTLGDRDSARRHLRNAVSLAPARADLIYSLGLVCQVCDLLEEAERWLRRAIALKRPYAEAQVLLGYVWSRIGRLDEAIRIFGDVGRETPAYTLAYQMLAAALAEIGAPISEIMKAQKVIAERYPDQPQVVFPLVQYLRDIGDEAEAQRLATDLIDRQMEAAARDEVGRFGIRILFPDALVSRIGEFAFQLDLYVKMQQLGWIPPFTTILAAGPESIVNRSFLDYWRPFLTVVDDPHQVARLEPLKQRIAFNPVYLRMPDGIAVSKNRVYHAVQEEWHRQGRTPLLSLTAEHRERGREVLHSLGVPEEAWFVCLHVREGRYLKEEPNSQESARNANVMTYLPAVEEIVRRGGWVIRLGDPGVSPLPGMTNVVDYALSSARSEEMDVYLAASCRFFLGTTSGLFVVATVFGTPIACANFFPTGELLYTCNDVFVPKLIRERATGRLLSFEECLSMPLALTYDSRRLHEMGLDVVDSEPEDIRLLVEEMIWRLEGGGTYTPDDETLQGRWKALVTPYSRGDAGSRVAKDWLIRHRRLFRRS